MITIELFGGLGNQMFQYALGKSLQARGRQVRFVKMNLCDRSDAAHHVERPQYGLDGFCTSVPLSAAASNGHRVLSDWEMPFRREAFEADGDIVLRGHWQSERYFEGIAEQLREELVPAHQPSPRVGALAVRLRSVNSVAIHVRRGDYLLPRNVRHHGIMGADYYSHGLELIAAKYPRPEPFIFSDDPAWCRENVPGEVVSTGDRWWDMYLIGQCRHTIIANSSYSWWGAWIGDHQAERMVIAPQQWFVTPQLDARDIVPERWIKL